MVLRVTSIDWSHRVVTSEGGEPQLATNTQERRTPFLGLLLNAMVRIGN